MGETRWGEGGNFGVREIKLFKKEEIERGKKIQPLALKRNCRSSEKF